MQQHRGPLPGLFLPVAAATNARGPSPPRRSPSLNVASLLLLLLPLLLRAFHKTVRIMKRVRGTAAAAEHLGRPVPGRSRPPPASAPPRPGPARPFAISGGGLSCPHSNKPRGVKTFTPGHSATLTLTRPPSQECGAGPLTSPGPDPPQGHTCETQAQAGRRGPERPPAAAPATCRGRPRLAGAGGTAT